MYSVEEKWQGPQGFMDGRERLKEGRQGWEEGVKEVVLASGHVRPNSLAQAECLEGGSVQT